MRKQYIAPKASTVSIACEGMLAASTTLKLGGNTTIEEESAVLSEGRGWDSSEWSED
ncbi:hypothetical protein MR642_01285 [bacterium]|nr:hypothetical protein [bacterium]